MLRCGVIISFLVLSLPLCAQQMSSKYYEENPYEQESFFYADFSDTLFYRLSLSVNESIYERESKYAFSYTDYSYRAVLPRYEKSYLNGLDVSSVFDEYSDYALLSVLRRIQPRYETVYMGGDSPFGVIGASIAESYSVRVSDMYRGHRIRMQYADRNYRGAFTLSSSGKLLRDTDYSMNFFGRSGRDRYVKGVFTNSYSGSFDVEHQFDNGNRLSLFLLATPSVRSSRSWAVQETFDLTLDNLYNPSWGLFDGKVRSSNVREDLTHLSVITYDIVGIDNTALTVSAMYRSGQKSRSGFTWFNAASPIPDTYSFLPSYYSDKSLSESVADAWRNNDVRYTQINWDEMYYQNITNGTQSVYILDQRVERISNVQLAVTGASNFDSGVESSYGMRYRLDDSRYFKRTDDMLGGEWIYDIDQYMIDDVRFGQQYNNDIRYPDRKVGEGEKFGYDYSIGRRALTVYDNIRYIKERIRIDVGGELSFISLSRNGYSRKQSVKQMYYGQSKQQNMSTYSLKAAVKYALSSNSSVALTAFASEYEPLYDNIFLSPQISNQTTDKIENTEVYGVDFRWLAGYGALSVDFAAYWNYSKNQTDILRYYDDVYGEYCDMVLGGIATKNSGIELGVDADLTSRLSLYAVVSYNSFRYASNPAVNIYRDADGEMLSFDGVSRMKGLASGQSPELLCMLGLSYDLFGSWWLNADYSYADRRYSSVSPLRRTSRLMSMASSLEDADMWHSQEKLASAGNIDVSLYHRFRLGTNYLSLSVAVRNLLDRRDIVFSAYEQSRFKKSVSGIDTVLKPYGNKYAYSYPRNCYITLTYEF